MGSEKALLEEVRSCLKGRGKGEHLRQEAQHVGKPRGARGLGSLRHWERGSTGLQCGGSSTLGAREGGGGCGKQPKVLSKESRLQPKGKGNF